MSESAVTVIKILSSLTSPKASVKYIAVGVFMLLAWKYLNSVVEIYGVPSEHRSVIVLFIGLGLGSLIGHFVYSIINFLWSKYETSRLDVLKQLDVQKAEKEAEKEQNIANNILLENFKKVYPHYNRWTKQVIRNLSLKESDLKSECEEVTVPTNNGYILKVANIDREQDIYKLHPVLTDFVSIEWRSEVDGNTKGFFDNYDDHKQELIKLLELKNRNDETQVSLSAINVVGHHRGIFDIEAEDDVGFYISVDQPYYDFICDKLDVELADETYILKARITEAKDVA
jgi:hypothetical protein